MAIYERMTIRGRGGALPTYQRQTGAYAPGAGVSARMDDSAARIASAGDDLEARALIRLGDTMNKAVQVGVKAYDDYSKSKATQLITRYRRDMNMALYGENGILTQKGEAALDADEQRAEAARKLRDSLTTDANEYTKRYFNILADDYDADTSLKAQQYAGKERVTMMNRNDEAAAEERAENAIASYANENDFNKSLGESLWYMEQRLRRDGYSDEALQRGLKATSSKVFRGAIESALAGNDVASARRLLERGSRMHGEGDGAWSRMTADDVAWGRNAIRTRQEALQAKAEANANKAARDLLKGYDDAVYLAEAKGDTSQLDAMVDGLRRLGKTEEADNLARKTKLLADTREISVFAMNEPLPEVKQRIDQLEAEVNAMRSGEASWDAAAYERASKEYDVAVKAYTSRTTAMKNDPAAAADASANFALPDDATMEDKAAARVEYQVKNGIPVDMAKPLTKAEEENIATEYANSNSPAIFVQQMKQELGDQFLPAMKQLVASKKVPASMNLVANMNLEAGDLLAKAGMRDFAKLTESALGMQDADKTSMKNVIRDEMEEVMGTVMAQGTPTSAAQIQESAYLLALQYRTQGMDEKDAAKKAASEVFSSRYTVKGSFRVPIRFDADAVEEGTASVTDSVASSGDVDLYLPDNLGLSEDAIKRRKASMVRANGRWIVNVDESGLILVVGGTPVRDKAGNVITRKFEELESIGKASSISRWSPSNYFFGR